MNDNGFDLLGADIVASKVPLSWGRGTLALAAGAVGAAIFRKHPVLAFLDAAALASNIHAVSVGERTWKDAVKRMGRHVVATAGSLAMPKHPGIGYVAGAVAADLLIDGEGSGIIEEWTRYEGVTDTKVSGDIIDATIVEPNYNTKALVKR